MNKIIIPILILLIVVGLFGSYDSKLWENFQSYKMSPYGEVYTGSDPLYFYSYPRYRKPFRWPYQYHSSYPYPHMSPLR